MFVLFKQAHQYLEVICHFLTNFAVHRDHVPPSCQVEVLSSHACNLCSTNPFSSTPLNWLFDRIFHLLLHLEQSSMEMCSLQLLCPGSSSPIQTVSDHSWHQDPFLQVKMTLRNCRTFVPNLRAIQPNSSHRSIHNNPAIITLA